jgi:hypothetical protein
MTSPNGFQKGKWYSHIVTGTVLDCRMVYLDYENKEEVFVSRDYTGIMGNGTILKLRFGAGAFLTDGLSVTEIRSPTIEPIHEPDEGQQRGMYNQLNNFPFFSGLKNKLFKMGVKTDFDKKDFDKSVQEFRELSAFLESESS